MQRPGPFFLTIYDSLSNKDEDVRALYMFPFRTELGYIWLVLT